MVVRGEKREREKEFSLPGIYSFPGFSRVDDAFPHWPGQVSFTQSIGTSALTLSSPHELNLSVGRGLSGVTLANLCSTSQSEN